MSVQEFHREVGMMKLDRLIAERERIPDTVFPVPVAELLDRYQQLYTGAISDVLREHCLLDQALPGHLTPLRPERCAAGIAFTVKSAPSCAVSGEMGFRTKMLEAMHRDAMVVWDASGDERATMWGGVMTATAHGKGVRGAVIDGGIRDTRQILDKDFPVHYRYRSPNGSLGRCLITHFQVPIRVGEVTIRPGDVVMADADGVVIVPRALAMEVLIRAEEIRANEKKIFGWVAEGQGATRILEQGGYF
jgi:4-hydroxy-4-methyl-2-oxoglutarate aldolase